MCILIASQHSPGSRDDVSVDSSMMGPFKVTATSEQKQATRHAMSNLAQDMSFSSSIHFDSSPSKSKRRDHTNQQLAYTANAAIETAVLMVQTRVFTSFLLFRNERYQLLSLIFSFPYF